MLNHLVRKLLLFLLPCALFVIGIEVVHPYVPHEFSVRRGLIETKELDGVLVGSSHVFYGINPELVTSARLYNFAWPSQSLEYDVELLDRIILPHEPQVVVMDMSPHMLPYRQYFGGGSIGPESYDIYYYGEKDSHIRAFTLKSCASRILKYGIKENIGGRFLRMNSAGFGFRKENIEVDTKGPEDARWHNEAWEDVEQVARNARMLRELFKSHPEVTFVLYLSPLHPIYRAGFDPQNTERYTELLNGFAKSDNIRIIDFSKRYDNHPEYFQDGDHLLTFAAQIVSKDFDVALGQVLK